MNVFAKYFYHHNSEVVAPPFDPNSQLWMQPTSGDLAALAVGDNTGYTIGGTTPTHYVGPEYHAGTVDMLTFPTHANGSRIYFPNIGGPFQDMGTPFWVGGVFVLTEAPANEGICGNGGNGTTDKGFRLLISSTQITCTISNGVISAAAGMPKTFPINVPITFLCQFKFDYTANNIIMRTSYEGYGIFTAAQTQRTIAINPATLVGVTPTYPGLVVGDTKSFKSLPFVGRCALRAGELPDNEFFEERVALMFSNHNKSRLYADVQKFNQRDFVKYAFVGPKDSGLVFNVRSDVAVKVRVYDTATYTEQGASALVAPVNGWAMCPVNALTPDQEVYAEIESATGEVAWWSWEHRVPATGFDMRIGVIGCWKGSEDPSLSLSFVEPFHLDSVDDCDFWVTTDDWLYLDPDVHYPGGVTMADFNTLHDARISEHKAHRILMKNSFVVAFGDHDYEADGDSSSAFIDEAIQYFRLRNPIEAGNYRVASGEMGFSIVVGGYRIIYLDVQSQRVNASGLTSAAQETWFAEELAAANTAGQIPIINWGQAIKNSSAPSTHQHWEHFGAESQRYWDIIAAEFGTSGVHTIHVSGDTHDAGIDTGGAGTKQSKFDAGGLKGAATLHCAGFLHSAAASGRSADFDGSYSSGTGIRGRLDLALISGTQVDVSMSLWKVATTQQGVTSVVSITK